jgi:hypothetical protein
MEISIGNGWGFYVDFERDNLLEKKNVVEKVVTANKIIRYEDTLNDSSCQCLYRNYFIIVLCILCIYMVFVYSCL